MRPLPLTALLLVFLEGSAASASDPAALLLAQVQKSYTKSPSFAVPFVQTYAPSGFPDTTPEKGKLTLQAPDRLRFDYEGAEGKVFSFDGRTARQLVLADKQMLLKTLSQEERSRLPLLFFESPGEIERRYAVAMKTLPDGRQELTLTPREGDEPRRLTLVVTADGEVKSLAIEDGAGNRTSFSFGERTPGPKKPADEFTLVPPAGTKIISE